MTIETEPLDDGSLQTLSVTVTITGQTQYGYNTYGHMWPYGLEVGAQTYPGMLVWLESPAAVDRLIHALHALKQAVAVKEALAAMIPVDEAAEQTDV